MPTYSPEYYLKNKEAFKARTKAWAAKNPELKKQLNHNWYEKNKAHVYDINRKFAIENPKLLWARQTINRHKRSKFDVQFTSEELLEFIKDKETCAICEDTLDWMQRNGNGKHLKRASLDRIANEKVMNLNNIQILCLRCNRAKQTMAMQEFIDYCHTVADKYPRSSDAPPTN